MFDRLRRPFFVAALIAWLLVVLVEIGASFLPVPDLSVAELRAAILRDLPAGEEPPSNAELQIDGGFYNRLTVTGRQPAPLSGQLDFAGDRTTDVEDIVVATKLRLLSETASRPAFALRLATRLPNAGNESGIGLDTMDFFATTIFGKTVQSVRVVGNAGLGILSDPTRGDRQGDVLTYGLSLARAVQQGVEVVGEINGRFAPTSEEDTPPGADSRAVMRVGGRFTRSTVRVDAGIILGMTARDPGFGFTAGLTWVFRAFTMP
jgi:hypothetical protein